MKGPAAVCKSPGWKFDVSLLTKAQCDDVAATARKLKRLLERKDSGWIGSHFNGRRVLISANGFDRDIRSTWDHEQSVVPCTPPGKPSPGRTLTDCSKGFDQTVTFDVGGKARGRAYVESNLAPVCNGFDNDDLVDARNAG